MVKLLSPANEVSGKVIFSQVSVCPQGVSVSGPMSLPGASLTETLDKDSPGQRPPPVYLSAYLCVFVCLPVYLFTSVLLCLPVYLFVYLCVSLFTHVFVCLPVYLFVYPCISLFTHVFVCLPVCLFVYLCICLL